jgi:hypothetical protein
VLSLLSNPALAEAAQDKNFVVRRSNRGVRQFLEKEKLTMGVISPKKL